MNFFSIATYLVLISVTLLIVYQAYLLKKKYPLKFLNSYYYYILLFYTYGFITFTTRIFFTQIGIKNSQFLNLVLTSIILPISIVSLYFLLLWTGELINRPAKNLIKIIYWILQSIVFVSFFFISLQIAEAREGKNSNPVFLFVNLIQLIFIIYPFLLLIFLNKQIGDKKIRKFSFLLGIQYIILFPFLMILIEFFHLPFLFLKKTISIHYFLTFSFYFVNIPPILYMRYFLKKNHHLFEQSTIDSEIDKSIFITFGITPKEEEIIALIIRGKTNEAIGDEIYCSTKTVKNNITSIYKKIGVKNRVELVSYILLAAKK